MQVGPREFEVIQFFAERTKAGENASVEMAGGRVITVRRPAEKSLEVRIEDRNGGPPK